MKIAPAKASWNYMSQTMFDMEGEPTVARQTPSLRTPTPLVQIFRRSHPVVLQKGEDGWLVARCLDVPGAISQGRSRDEALKNVAEAITAILEETSHEQPSEVVISWEEK